MDLGRSATAQINGDVQVQVPAAENLRASLEQLGVGSARNDLVVARIG